MRRGIGLGPRQYFGSGGEGPAPNPTPATTLVTPSSAIVGNGAQGITVNGSNFIPSSVVYADTTPLTTVYVNAGQLTATIPAIIANAAGPKSITVVSPGPGGGPSNAQTWTAAYASPT